MRARFTPAIEPIKTQEVIEKPRRNKPDLKRFITPVLIGLCVIGIGVLLIVAGMYMSKKDKPAAGNAALPSAGIPTSLTDTEVKALVAKVAKHLVLPPETPQIVAIANADQLKIDQPFFRSSQNGDQLLVYPNKVILYRPSTDQVVDVAQIRANPSSAVTAAATPSLTPTPSKAAAFATWTPTLTPAPSP